METKEFKITEKDLEAICHDIDSAYASFQTANGLLLKAKPEYVRDAEILFKDAEKKIVVTREKLKSILNS